MSWTSESTVKQVAFPIYGAVLLMLIVVEAVGFVGKGAQRWIDLGFIRLQPSEFMKPAIVLVLARFYELLPAGDIRSWRAIWPAAALIGVPAGLIILQPDLGTALMVSLIGVTVMFVAGVPLSGFPDSWSRARGRHPRRLPIAARLSAQADRHFPRPRQQIRSAPAITLRQSKIAIGSGGIFGKGYLNGSQSHLDYLPEGHTDFVFATMVEEWGLFGGALLILAFAFVIRWGMRVAANGKTRFAQLAAAGLSATIFFYVAINLMMVMGLAPVVGVPLPLVSFGGSAVMTIMLCLGILMALERQQRTTSRLI